MKTQHAVIWNISSYFITLDFTFEWHYFVHDISKQSESIFEKVKLSKKVY